MATTLKSASFGGNGGSSFSADAAAAQGRRVTGIKVRHGRVIDSIQFIYDNGPGAKHGGNGGSETEFTLAKGEVIIGAHLYTGSLVDSISLVTSNNRLLHAGGTGGGKVDVAQPSGTWEIAGAYGRSGRLLDNLGFVWRLVGENPIKLQSSAQKGGSGGSPFQLDSRATQANIDVTAIRIWSGSKLDAIQVVYANGETPKYGGGGGSKHELVLKARERFVGCSGRSGSLIDRIRFWTNQGRVLEGGGGGGSAFEFDPPTPVPEGTEYWEIAGVSGRKGRLVDALAVGWRARPDVESIIYSNFDFDWAKKSKIGDPVAQTWDVKLGPNNTDVEQSLTSTQEYTMQLSNTYTDSWSTSHSDTLSFTETVTVSAELGIEDIFKIGGSASVSSTQSSTTTNTTGGSASNTVSDTYALSVAFQVNVPPRSTVRGEATSVVEKYTVPYTAHIKVTYKSGKTSTAETSGTMEGMESSVQTSYHQE